MPRRELVVVLAFVQMAVVVLELVVAVVEEVVAAAFFAEVGVGVADSELAVP